MRISDMMGGTAAMDHNDVLRVIYAQDDYEGVAITAPKSYEMSPLDSVPDRETAGLYVTHGQFGHGMFDHDLVENVGESGDGADAFLDGNTPAGRVNWGEASRSVDELLVKEQVSAELVMRARMRQPNMVKNQRRKLRKGPAKRESMRADGQRFLILEEVLPSGVARRKRIPMQYSRVRQITPTVFARRPIAPNGAVIPVATLQSIATVAG